MSHSKRPRTYRTSYALAKQPRHHDEPVPKLTREEWRFVNSLVIENYAAFRSGQDPEDIYQAVQHQTQLWAGADRLAYFKRHRHHIHSGVIFTATHFNRGPHRWRQLGGLI